MRQEPEPAAGCSVRGTRAERSRSEVALVRYRVQGVRHARSKPDLASFDPLLHGCRRHGRNRDHLRGHPADPRPGSRLCRRSIGRGHRKCGGRRCRNALRRTALRPDGGHNGCRPGSLRSESASRSDLCRTKNGRRASRRGRGRRWRFQLLLEPILLGAVGGSSVISLSERWQLTCCSVPCWRLAGVGLWASRPGPAGPVPAI